MRRIGIIWLLVFAITSCKKAEDRACIKGAGEEVVKTVELASFNKLELGPHLNFNLVQDTINKIVITGGKNLVNFVESNVEDGLLTIFNKNKCNFLRSYKKEITVDVHFINVVNILFEGTKPLYCKNTINTSDLAVTLRDGAGKFNLDVNANSLTTLITHGWCNYNLTGNVNFLKLNIRSNGFGTSNINVTDSVSVIMSSAENIKLFAGNVLLRAEISGGGNVGYTGVPSNIILERYGSGELIDEN